MRFLHTYLLYPGSDKKIDAVDHTLLVENRPLSEVDPVIVTRIAKNQCKIREHHLFPLCHEKVQVSIKMFFKYDLVTPNVYCRCPKKLSTFRHINSKV